MLVVLDAIDVEEEGVVDLAVLDTLLPILLVLLMLLLALAPGLEIVDADDAFDEFGNAELLLACVVVEVFVVFCLIVILSLSVFIFSACCMISLKLSCL